MTEKVFQFIERVELLIRATINKPIRVDPIGPKG
jgi:hypothetical protein